MGIRQGPLLLLAIGIVLAVLLLVPPIPQPEAYHDFADQRPVLGIPNGLNVVSNLAFILVGLAGLRFLWRWRQAATDAFRHSADALPYLVFFPGVIGIGLGSGYYHLDPQHTTLFWDRLPIAVTFMALFAAILNEHLGRTVGQTALPLLVLVLGGAATAGYWLWSELAGHGDLRPYLLVQAIPMLFTPLLVLVTTPRYSHGGHFVTAICFYCAALAFDLLDAQVYALLRETISGHTLKHLTGAFAAWWILRMLQQRKARH